MIFYAIFIFIQFHYLYIVILFCLFFTDIHYFRYWRYCWRNVNKQRKDTYHPQIRQLPVQTGQPMERRTVIAFREMFRYEKLKITVLKILDMAFFVIIGLCTAAGKGKTAAPDQRF